MEDDTLEPGYTQPSLSAMKYMTVPEKIELAQASGGAYSTRDSLTDQSGYKPMKVPDMITLETITLETTITSSAANEGVDSRNQSQWSWDNRRNVPKDPPGRDEASDGPALVPKAPSGVGEMPADDHLTLVNLDQRVRTLEQQVQRLKDVAVARGNVHSVKEGNRFWYVVTFVGWMMVPLITVYMYRYRR